jgi:DME family drug/metabolite transporter
MTHAMPDSATVRGRLAGRLWVLGAAVLWSLCGLFAKAPIFEAWDADVRGPLLAFWRAMFAAMVLLPAVRRPRWSWCLVPMTVIFTMMCITYLSAVTLTTAANAIWLQATAPFWVFLILVVLLRQPIDRHDLIPLGFAVAGVGTILWFEVQGQAMVGVACGLAAGVGYAAMLLFLRVLRGENGAWLIAVNHLVAAAIMLPWVIYLGVWPSSLLQFAVLAAFGAFQMGIPYLMMFRALRTIPPHEAVAIALLEPVLMPLWVALVWGEIPAWWTIVGASLILIGLLLRYVVWELVVKSRSAS